ncbi:MAG: bifunctional UDP-N-acetylglucosamine diphosphorylase/glucosamine-1-phosphate N-acetyltransferase GlmU [Candidatus Dormibacteria bacterium]|jgi:bifunctional UDP-N-acetylglucosamine pyrophosphorylase/glucosamine-1-phosphate N-acetyltransferase
MADAPRAVILAAGQGTRMRSARPKVLHPLAGRPMLLHVVEAATAATGAPPVVVLGPGMPAVHETVQAVAEVVVQPEPRGTGDAVRSLPAELREEGPVVVIYGDLPLLRAETIRRLVRTQATTGAACVLLTVVPDRPAGLGRVVRGSSGRVERIVEERDLPQGQPVPAECNAGVYVFSGSHLWPALERLSADNAQGEHYLTDVVALLAPEVEAVLAADPEEALGVNDRRQLAAAEAVLRHRLLEALMLDGVTVEDPATTYVDAAVRVGADTLLRPMTVLRGETVIGRDCEIGPMAQIRDTRIGDRVRIGASVIEEAEIGDGVEIGHFNRVRPGSVLESGVSLGTHAEVKNSRVGAGSRVNHFSCVLDSDVGSEVNIGAGTVTCNYDGREKHRTAIEDGAFIGSNSSLVAPLRVGRGAYVAAASAVTRDVPDGALAVGRARQRTIEGWRRRNRPESPPA